MKCNRCGSAADSRTSYIPTPAEYQNNGWLCPDCRIEYDRWMKTYARITEKIGNIQNLKTDLMNSFSIKEVKNDN